MTATASPWLLTAKGGTRAPDPETVGRALGLLADPENGVQLHYAPFHRRSFKTFAGSDLAGMLAWVETECKGATGVYYTLNPVPPGLAKEATSSAVLKRRWLLIDIDRVKTAETLKLSATDAEHAATLGLAADVLAYLADLGWPCPVVIDSGNGTHLLYRTDLPNDEPSRLLVKGCLAALAARFDGPRGAIGAECHDARRVAKLPGTWARKGPDAPDRPHRMARLLEAPEPVGVVSAELLAAAAPPKNAAAPTAPAAAAPQQVNGAVHDPLTLTATSSGEDGAAWARAALEGECRKMAASYAGKLNNDLRDGAFRLGQLVEAGLLDYHLVVERLYAAAQSAGCDFPQKDLDTLRRSVLAGMAKPREAHRLPERRKPVEPTKTDPADVATIADLERAGAEINWLWELWVQRGVVTILAAEAGCGKTRLMADLLRRVRHGLAWPDGRPVDLPPDGLSLWVVADNHHDEMVSLCRSHGIADVVRVNATRAEPYGGTTIDGREDLADLEGRIAAVRPAFLVVDTVGNSTDRNLSIQEDAKAYYVPLQQLARKYKVAVVCLTHLNAAGQVLGRRAREKARTVVLMSQPDPENQPNRRKLWVSKSNSKYPAALGVTMGDTGNEYDDNPPVAPEEQPRPPRKSPPTPGLDRCCEWLRDLLMVGPMRVSVARTQAEQAGFSSKTLYAARDSIGVREYEEQGRKWWELTSTETATE